MKAFIIYIYNIASTLVEEEKIDKKWTEVKKSQNIFSTFTEAFHG